MNLVKACRFSVVLWALTVCSPLTAQNSDPSSPIPDYYSEGGIASFRDQLASEDVEEQIDPFSGRVTLVHTDVLIPGNGGLDLRVTRSYNNAQLGVINQSDMGALGIGWDISFGRVLLNSGRGVCDKQTSLNSKTNHVFQLPDGSRHVLYPADVAPFDTYTFVTPNRWVATCTTGPDGQGLIITSPEGLQYHMTKRRASGFPALLTTMIRDRNDNTINITYGIAGGSTLNFTVITGVTTSDGRSLTFTYNNQSTPDYSLATVKAGTRTWTYTYQTVTGLGAPTRHLINAKRPDNLSWKYTYYANLGLANPNSYSLNTLTYPRGAKATYAYQNVSFGYAQQSSVILTKAMSGTGISSATWGYQFSASNLYDQTIVTAPGGSSVVHRHVGYLAAANDNSKIWKVGSLISKQTISSSGVTLQSEDFTWDRLRISSQRLVAQGNSAIFNNEGAFAPLASNRTIYRGGNGHFITFSSFDSFGYPRSIQEDGTAGSRTTQLTYENNLTKYVLGLLLTQSVTGAGTTRTNTYDTKGNLLTAENFGVRTTFTYSAAGDIASRKNARNNTTNYTSYKRGIAQTVTEPESIVSKKTVSDAGSVTSAQDANLKTVSYTYNGLNQPTAVTYPIHSPVSVTWSTNSIKVTRGAFVETTTLDGLGRPTKIDRSGIANTYQYDAFGRRTFVSYPCVSGQSCSGRTYSYDALGRVTQIENNGVSRSIAYTDSSTVTLTNERGFKTIQTFKAYGDPDDRMLTKIKTPTTETNTVYDRLQLLQTVSQGGLTRTLGYNANKFIVTVADPETGTTVFGRDAVGNMMTKKIGSGGMLTYTYDLVDRLKTVSDSTGVISSTTYDKAGNALTVTSPCTVITYAYDALSELTSEQHVDSCGGPTLTAAYGYNALDQLSSITYPSGRVVQLAPDLLGRPTQAGPYVTAATYFPNGVPKLVTYGNGVTEEQTLTSRQLIGRLLTKTSAGASIVDLNYAYDNGGNVTSISDPVTPSNNFSAQFDGDDQVLVVGGAFGSGSVVYDALGNISRLNLGLGRVFNFAYSSNRLTTVSGSRAYTMTYDNNGNATYDGQHRYTYDARNLLISAKP